MRSAIQSHIKSITAMNMNGVSPCRPARSWPLRQCSWPSHRVVEVLLLHHHHSLLFHCHHDHHHPRLPAAADRPQLLGSSRTVAAAPGTGTAVVGADRLVVAMDRLGGVLVVAVVETTDVPSVEAADHLSSWRPRSSCRVGPLVASFWPLFGPCHDPLEVTMALYLRLHSFSVVLLLLLLLFWWV
jgi:hypothetical protein